MQSLRPLLLTLFGYVLTTVAIAAYFWGVAGPPGQVVSSLAALLLCMAGVLCAWLCFAASTARPSPVAFALGCGFAAATASYAIAAAMLDTPRLARGYHTPPLSYWTLPAGGVTLLTLLVQRHSKLRLRHELGISIFAAFALGCIFAFGNQLFAGTSYPINPQSMVLKSMVLISGVACLLAAAIVFVRARNDAFQLSWAGGAALVGFTALSGTEAAASPGSYNLPLTLTAFAIIGIIPVSFCLEAVRAIRAQAAQSGDFDPATRDALTGLYNRRALDTMGRELYLQALRADRPVSILMFDIDHFKQVNDLHGHAAGDAVLAKFAAVISDHVRTSDFVARYGGEEFAAILPGAPLAPAMRLAERIRVAVEQLEVQHKDIRIRATTSIGATTEFPGDNIDFRQLMDRADKNLYRAKRAGRNQVITDPLVDEAS